MSRKNMGAQPGWAFFAAVAVTGFMAVWPAMAANNNVYISRFWHNHQPIYWPEWNGNGSQTERIQYAWDSIVLKDGQKYSTAVGHPENNLTDIFGLEDRKAAYQGRPRDSLAGITNAGGFAISYSGSLIDNVRNLGGNGQLGYSSTWYDGNREASGWTTPAGSRRLDLVGFTYHHSLGCLLPKEVFRKELQIFKQAWWKAWNKNADLSDHSKGFFPTEMAFSPTMVDVLVDEGYQWTIVASHHLSRTCPTYFNYANPTGTYNIYSSPPNRADLLGPSPTSGWWYNMPNPGQGSWNVSPHAYQLHKAKYVNPATGAEKTMVMVPSDDSLSYVAGYSGAQIGMVNDNISPQAGDSARPAMVMPATDGDNAWGGGYSSWMESVPGFFSAALSQGYHVTTPQDFVNSFGAAAPVAHVEDGAWIFPESDYGSPYFLKWLEPPLGTNATRYPNTMADLETPGFALKFWSWAPVVAGANWCETAEQIYEGEGGSVAAWKIQAPYDWDGVSTSPNVVERAWHIYLGGLDSGFNYYGGLGNDDEVKQSLATRRAIELLQTYMSTRLASDLTPPTVFKPQRFPWNPGGHTFGWFNSYGVGTNAAYLKKMGSEFYVWTHAYDVNGITNIVLKVRLDTDGVNTMDNNQNETYAGGVDVSSWASVAMTKRVLPNTQAALNAAANNGQIDYFPEALSPNIADYYFTKITDGTVSGFRGKLLDYYIEAYDGRGNVARSDIQHVYVENDGGGSSGEASSATFSSDPRDCAPLTVTYKAGTGVLSNSVPVQMQISFDQGTNWTLYSMTHVGGGTSTYAVGTVPDNAPSAIVWFQNEGGTIVDSRGGLNWSTSIRDCDAPTGPSSATTDPANPNGCDPVSIIYTPGTGVLQNASTVYIHVGYNGWTNVVTPDPAMSKSGYTWRYTYTPEPGTLLIDVAFNNGAGTWDSHGGSDWHFAVSNCEAVVVPDGVVITNPAVEIVTVAYASSNLTLQGTAGSATTGHLSWSNTLTRAGGTLAKATRWSVAGVALAVGTNVISVTGTNSSAAGRSSSDDAAQAAYADGWVTGDNGGTGWGGGWTLGASGSGGQFIANSNANATLNITSPAFGLWANGGGSADAVRPFSASLQVGQTLSLEFENNGIQAGGSVGFGLQNAGGTNLIEFYFPGGEANYKVSDSVTGRDTGLGWRNSGWNIAFTLTAAATYQMTVGTNVISGTLAASADQGLRRFRFWNFNAGSGGDADAFFNKLQISGGSGGAASVTGDTVTVIREADQVDTDGDGLPDEWENANGLDPNSSNGVNGASGDLDNDGFPNLHENWLGTSPTNPLSGLLMNGAGVATQTYPRVNWLSVGGRSYDVQYLDNLGHGGGFQTAVTVTETGVGDGTATNRSFDDDYTHTGGPPTNGFRAYRIRLHR